MFYHNINPVLFSFGPIEVRWYGIIYALGFVLTYLFLVHYSKTRKIKNFNKNAAIDFVILEIIAVVIGARLFEILFYSLGYYIQNPLQMLMIWNGGLSFHGGLVGAIVGCYIFCKKKKINMLKLADLIVIPVAFGLFLGRIANFINGELYGIKTNIPCCVNFQNVEGCRHPSQIYEALKNLGISIALFLIEKHNHIKKKMRDGSLFFLFIILYGTLRFFIEFVKDLPIVFLGLKMGQVLSLLMVVAGAIWFIRKK